MLLDSSCEIVWYKQKRLAWGAFQTELREENTVYSRGRGLLLTHSPFSSCCC